jgi:hypothetical protein
LGGRVGDAVVVVSGWRTWGRVTNSFALCSRD